MLLRKQAVKWYFIFPPHLTSASALPGDWKPKIASFHLNAESCFASRRWKHIHGHSGTALHSHKNQPFVPNETSEASVACHATVCYHTHSSFTKSVVMSIAVSKVGVVPCRSLKWKVNGQYWWDILLSQQMLAVIKVQTRCRRQYHLPFSNTAHACTSAWCVQHSSTAAAQNSQLHFFWAISPNRQHLDSINYEIKGVYISMNISFKSTKLKKSSSDWLKSEKQ